jgi:hypothetical protein
MGALSYRPTSLREDMGITLYLPVSIQDDMGLPMYHPNSASFQGEERVLEVCD